MYAIFMIIPTNQEEIFNSCRQIGNIFDICNNWFYIVGELELANPGTFAGN